MRRALAILAASLLATSALAQNISVPVATIATPVTPTNGGSGVANTGNLTWNAAQTLSFTSGQTMTFPAATDTLVGLAATQTLTNKTLTSPTLVTPALGTPSSATLTNATGLPLTTGVTGTLPIANGGTGAATTSQNFAFIGPTSGAGAPSFRALVAGDIPSLSTTYLSLTGGTLTGALTNSFAPGASQSAITLTGSPYAAGTGTTNFPLFYLNSGAAPTTFNTAGTMLGINAPSGFTGNYLDIDNNGVEKFSINSAGNPHLGSGAVIVYGTAAIISSPANNQFQIGNVDAATANSQTLRSQGVIAGTLNTPGQNFTILASPGTGTGIGGSLVFQTAPAAGTSGSGQNSGQTVLTIDSKSHAGWSSAAIPTLSSCGSGSPTVTAGSTDIAGAFTVGTTASACTLTFKQTFTNAPFCVLSDITLRTDLLSYTISTSALVLTMTANSGDVVDYICNGN